MTHAPLPTVQAMHLRDLWKTTFPEGRQEPDHEKLMKTLWELGKQHGAADNFVKWFRLVAEDGRRGRVQTLFVRFGAGNRAVWAVAVLWQDEPPAFVTTVGDCPVWMQDFVENMPEDLKG